MPSCQFCGFEFQRATGKFCGKCGARRPDNSTLTPANSGATTATATPPTMSPSTSPGKLHHNPSAATTTPEKKLSSTMPASKLAQHIPGGARSSAGGTTTPTTTPGRRPPTAPATGGGSPSSQLRNDSSNTSPTALPPPQSFSHQAPTKQANTMTTTTAKVSSSNSINSGSLGNVSNTSSTPSTTAAAPAAGTETTKTTTFGNTNNHSSSTTNHMILSTSSTNFDRTLSATASSAAFAAVRKCLATTGLTELLDKFVELNITDEALPFVEEEDLISAGVSLGAHRRQLLSLFCPNQSEDVSSPTLNKATQLKEEDRRSDIPNNSNNNNNYQQQQPQHPVTTLKAPEDGTLLSPEMLETANANTLRGWRKGSLLGRGSFGSVWMSLVPETGKFYAVKVIPVNLNDPSNPTGGIRARDVIRISREISMMRRIQHENICQFYGCVYKADEREVCLFMELMLGGTLVGVASKFMPLPPETVRSWSRQLLTGLRYLHEHSIVHRDLKCGNVVVDLSTNARTTGQLKLVDFGAAKRLADEFAKTSTVVGSPYWLAPEVVMTADGYDGYRADVWSLGCTICEMITGRPPWPEKQNSPQAILMIAQADAPTEMPTAACGKVSVNCEKFLRRCFVKEPKKRATSAELMEDPWITGAVEA